MRVATRTQTPPRQRMPHPYAFASRKRIPLLSAGICDAPGSPYGIAVSRSPREGSGEGLSVEAGLLFCVLQLRACCNQWLADMTANQRV